MAIIQGTSKAAGGASYEIDQSVRFNDLDSAFLARTPSASNRKTWTWSAWVKRSNLFNGTVPQILLSAGDGGANDFVVQFGQSDDTLRISDYISGTVSNLITTQLFRDVGAWYHFVLAYDTTQGTAANRIKLYVNGSQVTAFGTETNPSLNADLVINSAIPHNIGRGAYSSNGYFSGYIAEINFVDGTALAPTAFGETNDDGVWIPKAYSGAYGTNGYYLTGADSTALGEDVRISGDQVISYAASQYTGATGSYTYSNGRLEADSANKAIKTADTFAGDFEFSWNYVAMANLVIGVYETGEDGTFSDSSSAGNMQNMTDSWYIQTSSVAANRDIFYGGAVQVNATTIANGDTWKMTRSSGTIKLIRNGSDVHTFSQTSTNTVRIVVAQGDAAADLSEVVWVDNSTLGNNFFSTGMTTADQMGDTPTTVYPTINSTFDYYTAGNTSYFRPDFAVSKALDGNLKLAYASPNTSVNYCTMSFGSSGKFYFEVTAAVASSLVIGIGGSKNIELGIGSSSSTAMANVIGYYANGTLFDQNATSATYGNASSIGNGEFVGVAYSVDDDAIWFCDNGTWVDGNGTESSATVLAQIEAGNTTSAASTDFTDDQNAWFPFVAAVGDYPTAVFNFGQSSFTGAAPSGFTHLNTANLATPSITDGSAYFQPTLYTGNSSTQEINQSGNSTFNPGFVWIKTRSGAASHALFDQVRGVNKQLVSDDTGAELTSFSDLLTSFDADGFSLGADGTVNNVNVNTSTYVAWQWLANGSGSSNEDGTINTTSTSANTTSGVSVVTYSGNGSDNQTIGHGLGIAPKMIISKRRDASGGWTTYHDAVGINKVFYLNSTSAAISNTEQYRATPTSSVYTIGVGGDINNSSGTYVAYVFAEIPGYSSIGSYVGNGSTDGPFVATGFKPAFVLFKVSSNAPTGWAIIDNKRSNPFNPTDGLLQPDQSGAEGTSDKWDILSNGFKVRTTWAAVNGNGYTVTYMAFAEHPFGGDGVAPATAR